MSQDETEAELGYSKQIDAIVSAIESMPNINIQRTGMTQLDLIIRGHSNGLTCDKLRDQLLAGEPSILAGGGEECLSIFIPTLCPGDEVIVAKRLSDCINGG